MTEILMAIALMCQVHPSVGGYLGDIQKSQKECRNRIVKCINKRADSPKFFAFSQAAMSCMETE